jgi:hypothetical protein
MRDLVKQRAMNTSAKLKIPRMTLPVLVIRECKDLQQAPARKGSEDFKKIKSKGF